MYATLKCWQHNRFNEFEKLCEIPFDVKFAASVCKKPYGFVIAGGHRSDLCIEFNIVTNSWTQLTNMRIPRKYHGLIYIGGALYVFGGYSEEAKDASTTVEFIELEGGSWQQGPDLPIPAIYLDGKVADINGSVYLLENHKTNQLLQLDVEAKVWNKRASLPFENRPTKTSGMVSVNGKLLVAWIANIYNGLNFDTIKCCAQYSPETDTWCINKQIQQPDQSYPSYLIYYNRTLLVEKNLSENPRDNDLEQFSLEEGIEAGSLSPSNIKLPGLDDIGLFTPVVIDYPPQD